MLILFRKSKKMFQKNFYAKWFVWIVLKICSDWSFKIRPLWNCSIIVFSRWCRYQHNTTNKYVAEKHGIDELAGDEHAADEFTVDENKANEYTVDGYSTDDKRLKSIFKEMKEVLN